MLEKALEDIQSGKPVLIFDAKDREGETDIVYASQFIDNEKIRFMRKVGGGLICTTVRESDAGHLGLPFIQDFYRQHLGLDPRATDHSDLKYDHNSSFSVTINHRSTFTGVPDKDRSLTITRFSSFLSHLEQYNGDARTLFSDQFRMPGHVILIIARDGYFRVRRGHTELSAYLVEKAKLIPSATIVEMLDDDGNSLPREKARQFARENSLTFIEGNTIIEQWQNDQGNGYRGI